MKADENFLVLALKPDEARALIDAALLGFYGPESHRLKHEEQTTITAITKLGQLAQFVFQPVNISKN